MILIYFKLGDMIKYFPTLILIYFNLLLFFALSVLINILSGCHSSHLLSPLQKKTKGLLHNNWSQARSAKNIHCVDDFYPNTGTNYKFEQLYYLQESSDKLSSNSMSQSQSGYYWGYGKHQLNNHKLLVFFQAKDLKANQQKPNMIMLQSHQQVLHITPHHNNSLLLYLGSSMPDYLQISSYELTKDLIAQTPNSSYYHSNFNLYTLGKPIHSSNFHQFQYADDIQLKPVDQNLNRFSLWGYVEELIFLIINHDLSSLPNNINQDPKSKNLKLTKLPANFQYSGSLTHQEHLYLFFSQIIRNHQTDNSTLNIIKSSLNASLYTPTKLDHSSFNFAKNIDNYLIAVLSSQHLLLVTHHKTSSADTKSQDLISIYLLKLADNDFSAKEIEPILIKKTLYNYIDNLQIIHHNQSLYLSYFAWVSETKILSIAKLGTISELISSDTVNSVSSELITNHYGNFDISSIIQSSIFNSSYKNSKPSLSFIIRKGKITSKKSFDLCTVMPSN